MSLDRVLALAGKITEVKTFQRQVRGKVETVREHPSMEGGWNHPEAVGGHKVLGVYSHPESPHALYDLGHGLHAEGRPGSRPGPVLRSNTGLNRNELGQKGWKYERTPKPLAAPQRPSPGKLGTGAAKAAAKPAASAQPGVAGQAKGKGALAKVSAPPWTRKPGNILEYKNSKGIDRSKMPQLTGTDQAGKYHSADEMLPKFLKSLQGRNISVTKQRLPAWSMRPTQTTGDTRVVRGIADALKSGDLRDTKPVVISSDHHIIDGHHTWAGHLLADSEGGRPDLKPGMPTIKVGMPIDKLLEEAHKFQASQGLSSRKTGEIANPAFRGLVEPKPSALTKVIKAAPQKAARAGKPDALKRALTSAASPKTAGALSDEDYRAYLDKLERSIGEAVDAGHTTDKQFTMGDSGLWSPDRAEIHNQIVQQFLAKYANVPTEGKAIIAGGLGGAGKSTVLARDPDIKAGKYATVNPDDIKEELAKRGLVPELPGMPEATPMERTALVHEESSHVAKLLAGALEAQHKNMVWDITMSSPGGVESRLAALRSAGYGHVHGMFVHIPVEKSVQSAQMRHRAGLEAARAGTKPLGERYVPSGVIRHSATQTGSVANRDTFEQEKPNFDSWDLWDRSAMKDAKLVGSGGTKAGGGAAPKAQAPEAGLSPR